MPDPRQTARELTDGLQQAAGENLRSVVLHGSVARGEAIAGVSDINVLVLLENADPATLQPLSALARRWTAAGNSTPLLLTWDEWRRAADAFAIEAADMRQSHEVLHGDDPVAPLRIEVESLRLQAERELRGKLIQLRAGCLLSADEPGDIGGVLLTALPSFTTYLRATLRLQGRDVPTTTPDVIRQACALVDALPEPFLRAWDARSQRRMLRPELDDPLVQGYFEVAVKTAAFVDAFESEARR